MARGLSQFSFDENGTVPFHVATAILSPILNRAGCRQEVRVPRILQTEHAAESVAVEATLKDHEHERQIQEIKHNPTEERKAHKAAAETGIHRDFSILTPPSSRIADARRFALLENPKRQSSHVLRQLQSGSSGKKAMLTQQQVHFSTDCALVRSWCRGLARCHRLRESPQAMQLAKTQPLWPRMNTPSHFPV